MRLFVQIVVTGLVVLVALAALAALMHSEKARLAMAAVLAEALAAAGLAVKMAAYR